MQIGGLCMMCVFIVIMVLYYIPGYISYNLMAVIGAVYVAVYHMTLGSVL